MNRLWEKGDDLGVGLRRRFNVPDWLEMGSLRGSSKRSGGSIRGRPVALCRGEDGDVGMGLLLYEDIWHLGGRRKLVGTGVGLVVEIGAVCGGGLGGDWDRGRSLWPPVVGTRRVVGRVEVGGSRGKGEGRQVGQFEGSLFCAEGPVYGMRRRLFTVISVLRVVCCGGIVGSRRGRVAHLRATDDKALGQFLFHLHLHFLFPFPRQWPCLPVFAG